MQIDKRTKLLLYISLVLAILSIVIFIVGTFTTMLLVEDHDFIKDVISTTGHDNPYAWLFNSSLIISGILMIPCFPAIFYIMKNEQNNKPKLLLSLIIFGSLIGPFMTLAGIFNEGDNFVIHVIFAVGAYLFVVITAFCWGIYVKALDQDHPYKKFKIWILDLIVNLIIIVCIVAYSIAMIFFQDFVWVTLGILEKSTIYAFFLYFILIIVRFLIIINKK